MRAVILIFEPLRFPRLPQIERDQGDALATSLSTNDKKNPSSEIALKHIDAIVQKVGADHAAIGSDFDGWIPRIPQDMQDARDLPVLTQGMLNIGYSPERIKKILGENFLRAWEEILNS